ncbi:hypothetical protein F4776DRAFT_677620 [Hypoxylon sp. NC0597]|nr:hypothetical protein F4776DRAFT_677620 [Hypoxylon sp. NC0597]
MTVKQVSDQLHHDKISSGVPPELSSDEEDQQTEMRFVLLNRREAYGGPYGVSAHLTPKTRMESSYYLYLPTFRFPKWLESHQKLLSATESPDETKKASKGIGSQGEGEKGDNQTQTLKRRLLQPAKKLPFLWDEMWWIRREIIALIFLILVETFILLAIVFVLQRPTNYGL